MATYAALISLTNTIDQIHPHKPTFTAKQLLHIQSLQEKAYFLQDFFENYNVGGAVLTQQEQEDLERRIADVVYQAEDIIESHIVDDIEARISMRGIHYQLSHLFKNIIESHIFASTGAGSSTKKSNNHHISHLPEVIRFMDSITKEVMMIKKNSRGGVSIDHQRKDLVPVSVGSPRSAAAAKDTTTVVFDDKLNEIMNKLTGQGGSCLKILPIIGMGGIGKTTLAKHVYDNAYVMEYFDIRGWITISQAYDTREILLDLALTIGVHIDGSENYQLVEKLYKHLSGRRYLIIIDDVWDIDAWDKIKASFPKNDHGSCIVLTSRLSNVASYVASSDIYQMNLLDDDKSWRLLCRKVFDRECCPLELEEIGKKIAKRCKGLPLSIAVIGGLLAKSEMTQEYWRYVANNINTSINFEDDQSCLKILSLSYNHLPIYLKPCFLYMGVFPEDYEIRVPELIMLWVAEGFLKPNREKSLEEVAEDCLKDLTGRNLIFVKLGTTGNLKTCSIHDLLRDLCLREAHREGFFCVSNSTAHYGDSQGLERRIAIHYSATYRNKPPKISCASLPRTVLSFIPKLMPSIDSKLLRTCRVDNSSRDRVTCSMNSRYLSLCNFRFPDEIDSFWNLQTLVIRDYNSTIVAPSKIWEMSQLRHLMVQNIYLPNPPSGRTKGHDDFVLRNLQTLSYIEDFRCTEEVLRMIPNVKKLKVVYSKHYKGLSHYCIKNLKHLHKLQSLHCNFMPWATRSDFLQNLGFSTSLKKLTLLHCGLDWEDMATKIGPLPNLEKLTLLYCFKGEEWSPVEGQFLRLKFLKLEWCPLICWTADDTHFPCLERLVLIYLFDLEEIPLGFTGIATLQSIRVKNCNKSVITSAIAIQEEQRNFENEDFRLILEGEYLEDEDEDEENDEEEEDDKEAREGGE